MSERGAFRSTLLLLTASLGMAAIAACTIPLRDQEQKADAAAAPAPTDLMGSRLRECSSVTPEQEDLLRACRKIWSARRRIFLKDAAQAPADPVPKSTGEPPPTFPLAPSKGH